MYHCGYIMFLPKSACPCLCTIVSIEGVFPKSSDPMTQVNFLQRRCLHKFGERRISIQEQVKKSEVVTEGNMDG